MSGASGVKRTIGGYSGLTNASQHSSVCVHHYLNLHNQRAETVAPASVNDLWVGVGLALMHSPLPVCSGSSVSRTLPSGGLEWPGCENALDSTLVALSALALNIGMPSRVSSTPKYLDSYFGSGSYPVAAVCQIDATAKNGKGPVVDCRPDAMSTRLRAHAHY